jgi:phosphomannomutase
MTDGKPKSYFEMYAEFLAKNIDLARPLSIVCDASNGPAGLVISALADTLKKAIAEPSESKNKTGTNKKGELRNVPAFTVINGEIDPDFGAHGPNPLVAGATDMLSKKVTETKADFGVIFDSDADRAVIVDDEGSALPAYVTALLLFKHSRSPYIADELLYQAIKHSNPLPADELIPCRVGSRFIKEKIKETGASRGAEISGHYYFKEFFGFDSGIFTMIIVANALSKSTGPLSDFRKSLRPHEVIADNIAFAESDANKSQHEKILKNIFKKLDASFSDRRFEEHRDGTTFDFGDSWLNIRTSNTEPLLRFTAGAPNKNSAQALIDRAKKTAA